MLATDDVSEPGLSSLTSDDRFAVVFEHDSGSSEFEKIVGEADALIVRSATTVGEEMLSAAPNLKVIGRAGVGVDNIDLGRATELGIAVINAPGGNTVSVAELALGLLLALVRNLIPAATSMEAGRWDRSILGGSELRGRTLAIVGLGRIGGEVARRARAFGM